MWPGPPELPTCERGPASLLGNRRFTLDRIPGRHRRCPSCPSPWTRAKDVPAYKRPTGDPDHCDEAARRAAGIPEAAKKQGPALW